MAGEAETSNSGAIHRLPSFTRDLLPGNAGLALIKVADGILKLPLKLWVAS